MSFERVETVDSDTSEYVSSTGIRFVVMTENRAWVLTPTPIPVLVQTQWAPGGSWLC